MLTPFILLPLVLTPSLQQVPRRQQKGECGPSSYHTLLI